MSEDDLTPLAPTLVADRFAPLGRELVALLGSLDAADWRRQTVCPAWSVHDVAAHLLDSALRRLSVGRDGHRLPPPAAPIDGYADLVGFLNGLNATWVEAFRRVSPRVLVDLLDGVEVELAAHIVGLDPWAPATFPVAWAGEDVSPVWFDVARELTERWHHQGQIRLAVGAPPLTDPFYSEPVFDTFLRALPHRYRDVAAVEGTVFSIAIRGAATYRYSLRREADGWALWKGEAAQAVASIALDEAPTWLLLTKGMRGDAAREVADVTGDLALTERFFSTLAVMA